MSAAYLATINEQGQLAFQGEAPEIFPGATFWLTPTAQSMVTHETRELVHRRACGRCEGWNCPNPGTDAHHAFSRGTRHVPPGLMDGAWNLVLVCRQCHELADHGQGEMREFLRELARERYREEFGGDIPVNAGGGGPKVAKKSRREDARRTGVCLHCGKSLKRAGYAIKGGGQIHRSCWQGNYELEE